MGGKYKKRIPAKFALQALQDIIGKDILTNERFDSAKASRFERTV